MRGGQSLQKIRAKEFVIKEFRVPFLSRVRQLHFTTLLTIASIALSLQFISPLTAVASEKLWAMGARGGSSQLRRAVASESIEKISSASDQASGAKNNAVEVMLVDAEVPSEDVEVAAPTDSESNLSPDASAEPALDLQALEALPAIPGGRVQVTSAPGAPRIPASQEVAPTSITAPDPTHEHGSQFQTKSHASPRGPEAAKVLGWLKNGNKRFTKQTQRRDGRSAQDRERLTTGQKPHAIVLSCSDSRVPPELVFDQALGEIFVIRSAGASVDDTTLASLEYAVEHLGPTLLVVMGHTSCGAVRAAVETKAGETAGSPHLDRLLANIRQGIPTRSPAAEHSKDFAFEGKAHTQHIASDLVKRSSILKVRVEKGDLRIQPALYDLRSGVVHFD